MQVTRLRDDDNPVKILNLLWTSRVVENGRSIIIKPLSKIIIQYFSVQRNNILSENCEIELSGYTKELYNTIFSTALI